MCTPRIFTPLSVSLFMKSGWQNLRVLIVMSAFLWLSACAPTKPPTQDMDTAAHAFSTARAANAQLYAPDEFRSAGQYLDQAQEAEAREDFTAAVRFARQSAADSDLASAKARLGKAREATQRLEQENANLSRNLNDHPSSEAQP
jgi:hypothetical protein